MKQVGIEKKGRETVEHVKEEEKKRTRWRSRLSPDHVRRPLSLSLTFHMAAARVVKLTPTRTAFLFCDIQSKFGTQ